MTSKNLGDCLFPVFECWFFGCDIGMWYHICNQSYKILTDISFAFLTPTWSSPPPISSPLPPQTHIHIFFSYWIRKWKENTFDSDVGSCSDVSSELFEAENIPPDPEKTVIKTKNQTENKIKKD